MTEQSFVREPAVDSVTLEDHEIEFERRLKDIRNTATHNLNRHYWRFLQLETVWNWVLRFIPPFEIDAEPVPDEDAMRLLLYFGGWQALDRPSVWWEWLDAHGLSNSLEHNFIRCLVPAAGFDASRTHSARLHPRWEKIIDRWLISAAPKPPPHPTQGPPELFPLLRHVSRSGYLRDLPVPFRSEAIDVPAI